MAGDESTLAPDRKRRAGSMELLLIALTALALSGSWVSGVLTDHARLAAAATVFCGVFVQALPFLVLGVIVSGLVAAYLTPERLARRLPRRPALAVAVAGVGGAALPGCECGSVPVARRLFSGETAGAALTFMLSAPAINPVVLVATAVAFPGQPQMVVARCVASLLTAVVMGLLWQRWGRKAWVTRTLPAHHDEGASRFTVFTEAARHDFLQSAAYLVVGAAAAAVLRAAVPPWVFEHVAGNLAVGVVTMALLAVEAEAAASFQPRKAQTNTGERRCGSSPSHFRDSTFFSVDDVLNRLARPAQGVRRARRTSCAAIASESAAKESSSARSGSSLER